MFVRYYIMKKSWRHGALPGGDYGEIPQTQAVVKIMLSPSGSGSAM